MAVTFGASGDIPVPADYNRDGRTDIPVFRPITGQWFIDTDLNGVAETFGQGDHPLRQGGCILKAMGILP